MKKYQPAAKRLTIISIPILSLLLFSGTGIIIGQNYNSNINMLIKSFSWTMFLWYGVAAIIAGTIAGGGELRHSGNYIVNGKYHHISRPTGKMIPPNIPLLKALFLFYWIIFPIVIFLQGAFSIYEMPITHYHRLDVFIKFVVGISSLVLGVIYCFKIQKIPMIMKVLKILFWVFVIPYLMVLLYWFWGYLLVR